MKFYINEFGFIYSYMKDIKDITELIEYGTGYMSLSEIDNVIECSKIEYVKHYDIIDIHGYSQGDYNQVIIMTDKLKDLWGVNSINLDNLSEECVNYCYDRPLICRLIVNNTEYDDGILDGCYVDYNKEELINRVLEYFNDINQDILKNELINILPDKI